jgi:hypothetical protein
MPVTNHLSHGTAYECDNKALVSAKFREFLEKLSEY